MMKSRGGRGSEGQVKAAVKLPTGICIDLSIDVLDFMEYFTYGGRGFSLGRITSNDIARVSQGPFP